MVTILAKLWIKDYQMINEPKVRQSYGILCGILGIVLNICLFSGKMVIGLMSGSIAIVADSLNNLADAGSSIITLMGFKLAMQEPDKEHPFGHGRFEYIAGFMVACIIIFMSFELLQSSITRIFKPQEMMVSWVVFGILISSILVKFYMAFYHYKLAKLLDSTAMKAVAVDSLSDCMATAIVLITALIYEYYEIMLDGYAGIIVGIFVFIAGINTFKDTINPLLGQPPSKEFVNNIYDIVLSYKKKGVMGIHDLVVHDYGPGRRMISLHVEVPATGDVVKLHEMIDHIEHHLEKDLSCEAVIHMDPISDRNEFTNYIKIEIQKILKQIDSIIQFHDLRVVPGIEQTNLIFDIVIPFAYKMKDEEVVACIQKEMKKIDQTFHCIIKVDKNYMED